MNKPTIKVFITSTCKFRAKIEEKDGPAYEVTIGGQEWETGKGLIYKNEIMKKIDNLMFNLVSEYKKLLKLEIQKLQKKT